MTPAEMESVFTQVFDQGTAQSLQYMCDTWNEMTDAQKQESDPAKSMNWKLKQLGEPKMTNEQATEIINYNCG